MHLTITVKAEAESREELIDRFAGNFEALREHFNQLKEDGAFGPSCDLRFLVVGGGFRPSLQEERSAKQSPESNPLPDMQAREDAPDQTETSPDAEV